MSVIKNNNGASLIICTGFAFSLILMATFIAKAISYTGKYTKYSEDALVAFYSAEGGLEEAMYEIGKQDFGYSAENNIAGNSKAKILGSYTKINDESSKIGIAYKWKIDGHTDEKQEGILAFGNGLELQLFYDKGNSYENSYNSGLTVNFFIDNSLFPASNIEALKGDKDECKYDAVINKENSECTNFKSAISWQAEYTSSSNEETKSLFFAHDKNDDLGKGNSGDCSNSSILTGSLICKKLLKNSGVSKISFKLGNITGNTNVAGTGEEKKLVTEFFTSSNKFKKLKFNYLNILKGKKIGTTINPIVNEVKYEIITNKAMTRIKTKISAQGVSRGVVVNLFAEHNNSNLSQTADYAILLN